MSLFITLCDQVSQILPKTLSVNAIVWKEPFVRISALWMLENVWKHKSYLDPQIKITARLILL